MTRRPSRAGSVIPCQYFPCLHFEFPGLIEELHEDMPWELHHYYWCLARAAQILAVFQITQAVDKDDSLVKPSVKVLSQGPPNLSSMQSSFALSNQVIGGYGIFYLTSVCSTR